MCGICGFIDRGLGSEELLLNMIDEIRYRGPDDRGCMLEALESGFRVGLAHCRLSILDLSAAGRQPMRSESGRTVISFNGEIYNYRELRAQLEQKGYLTRHRSAEDERNLVVAITDEGEALKEKAVTIPARMGQCVDLSPKEGEELYRLLYKILGNIGE